MKLNIVISTSFLCSILCLSPLYAQNSYLQDGPIGKTQPFQTIKKIGPTEYRPIEEWVGEKFIFIPSDSKYGYQLFTGGIGKYGSPTSEECSGRIGTIISVSHDFYNRIKIKMDDNGQIYTGQGHEEIDGIAPLLDIDYARKSYTGKTLWYNGEYINSRSANKEYSQFKVKRFTPVIVKNIVVSDSKNTPVRFIVETPQKEEGYIDVSLSGTNVPAILRQYEQFDDKFFSENPKITYKWPIKVWNAIEDRKVFVGMTADQARMSWGEPKDINKTDTGRVKHEQWVYSTKRYLYFENGKLTAIQK